jgi:hypothetical protein
MARQTRVAAADRVIRTRRNPVAATSRNKYPAMLPNPIALAR